MLIGVEIALSACVKKNTKKKQHVTRNMFNETVINI